MTFPTVKTVVVAALLSAVTGCGLGFGQGSDGSNASGGGDPAALSCTSTSDNYGYPIQTYDVAPGFVAAWWYIGQEPPEVATDEPVPSDEVEPLPADPQPDGTTAPGDDDDDDGSEPPSPPPDPNDPDASLGTQSLHAKDYGPACFTCDLTCTTAAPSPNQPAAIRTAHGVSATSHGAACRNAEATLRSYASSSYGLDLNSCGYSNGS